MVDMSVPSALYQYNGAPVNRYIPIGRFRTFALISLTAFADFAVALFFWVSFFSGFIRFFRRYGPSGFGLRVFDSSESSSQSYETILIVLIFLADSTVCC